MDLCGVDGLVVYYDDVSDVVNDVIHGKYGWVHEACIQEQGTLDDGAEEHCWQEDGQ